MLYNTPVRGEDGLYFVKALNDDKRKCLVQLNDVKVVETSGEVVFDVDSEENIRKIQEIDTLNLGAAEDNSMSWFGKELSGGVVAKAYTFSVSQGQISTDCIDETKIFNTHQEPVDFEVEAGRTCDVILEFAGIWFAKKAFGSSWNLVQVRIHDEPILDTYPEGYAFVE